MRFGGFDTQKELQYLRGIPALVRRGFSCLLVDGPGMGESIRFRGIHLRHDYETVGAASLDYLATRPDVDMNRIAVVALSLGGYFAPRCAALDQRFKACIACGAMWDFHDVWQRRIARLKQASLSVPADHLLWVFGVKTKEEAFRKLEGFRLDGVIQKMTCPYLLVYGEGDQQCPLWHAQKMIEAAGSARKELKIFTRVEGGYHHCQVDNVSIGTAYMWDWAADVLQARA